LVTRVRVRVRAADGTLLHAWRSEPFSSSACCVLLHGSGDGAHVWDPLFFRLAEICSVLAIDLRGHGESEASQSGSYSLRTHVADVEEVIARFRVERLILCGHSLGGQVAVQLASGPVGRRLGGVIVVDVCARLRRAGSRQVEQYLRSSMRRYASIDEYQAFLLQARPLLSGSIARELAIGALRPHRDGGYELKMDPRVVDAEPGEGCPPDWDRAFASINCPVLLVRGGASAFVNAGEASTTLELLRRGSLLTIERAGHAVMSDNPNDFVAGILPFVREAVRMDPH
jgi:pimeloyl-ACP methyl ester carboxylesterase